MNVIKIVLHPYQHLNVEDTEIYGENPNGVIFRKDGQPLTLEEASLLKLRYMPFDTYIGPA